ncbi:MAG: DUF4238 domain-containing protein [Limnobacter sp.]|uniref:DUF4238 domain-containing protein n=1 Tax=unclassified Limnobacter TaxID=2630203 RepID=UPI000D49FD72|nr:DUF4238 domain-containing protein [Limnobacter sp. SAORIC-690]PQJ23860.1 hypothetical protein BSZ31_01575 [Limnobacter sp. SAORIC-690]
MKRKKYEQRKQHFIPACYLKAWLDPSAPKTSKNTPYVWLFDKKGQNPKAKAPEKIFRESDMYTLTTPDGGDDLRLEHSLGTVESNFTKVRASKFNFKRPLTKGDWLWVCLFAATVHNRTAASRDHFLSQMEEVKEMFEKVAGPDWETRTIEPELPAHVDRSRAYIPQPGDFDNLKEMTTTTLLNSAADVILPTLLGMHKTVLYTTDPLGFITTDAPSTWCDPTAYRRHPFERAVGLGNPAIEITLPISPAQCLLFTHHPVGPLYAEIGLDRVDALNHRHAVHAPTTVITQSKETRDLWFQVIEPPADSWEALHPDPDERRRWTSPDCPLELRDFIQRGHFDRQR